MLKFFEKNKRLAPVAIVLSIYLVVGMYLFVVVSGIDKVEVSEKEVDERNESAQNHSAAVYLVIDSGEGRATYSANLMTNDRLMYLLDHLRATQGLTFNKVGYVHGDVLETINGITAQTGYEWKVFDNDKDISYDFEDVKLSDGHTYSFVLTQVDF